jgi:hypothetical protein
MPEHSFKFPSKERRSTSCERSGTNCIVLMSICYRIEPVAIVNSFILCKIRNQTFSTIIALTWLIRFAVGKIWPWVLGVRSGFQVWKKRKIGLNQPLTYIHTYTLYPHCHIHYFCLFHFNWVVLNTILRYKYIWGHCPPPAPYDCHH